MGKDRTMSVALERIAYPEIELPSEIPFIGSDEFDKRMDLILKSMAEEEFDFLVVYGDREHAANLQYVCGIDPRFEEMIAIINTSGEIYLLLGNEDYPYADTSTCRRLNKILYQSLSLMNQPRDKIRPLEELFSECGLKNGAVVGVAGWKYFSEYEFDDPEHAIEIPSYITDTLQKITGFDNVVNAGALFMHPERGLRSINSAQQLALFEAHATVLTDGALKFFRRIAPGQSEQEAFSNFINRGIPLSVHPMFSTGERALQCALVSPSSKKIQYGEPFALSVGIWGALLARAGYIMSAEDALKQDAYRSYLFNMVVPYFETVVSWYEALTIGADGGHLYNCITRSIEANDISLLLNPGHSIGYDEWLNTPFYASSQCKLRSGMLLQCDLIPVSNVYFGSNIEDTVAIADEDLRNQIAHKYPVMWERIKRRRDFMKDTLGIHIRDEVLPFSNIAGALAPFIVSPEHIMIKK